MSERFFNFGKRLIPKWAFSFFQPAYHWLLAYSAALYYRFPSRRLTIIGVTGTKGKSTVVYLVTRILEANGIPVAAVSSFEYRVNFASASNASANSMPGRFKLQQFLFRAGKVGATHAVIEVTSEGIAQFRHLGIHFSTAVFTNLEPEHIERHGSFENYAAKKQQLFARTNHNHVVNVDSKHAELFLKFPAERTLTYGLQKGELKADDIEYGAASTAFRVGDVRFKTELIGEMNVYNVLAAVGVCTASGLTLLKAADALKTIPPPPGRLQEIKEGQKFRVFVDYAHTPESLASAYRAVKEKSKRLICVLGAAGGGRDTWKRPEFGKIAAQYCDEIILTNEDPYDESPETILNDIIAGIPAERKIFKIIDRGAAIQKALSLAYNEDDAVIVTGKGSERSIHAASGMIIPWSDAETLSGLLKKK